jgi:hypothetical protein
MPGTLVPAYLNGTGAYLKKILPTKSARLNFAATRS